MKQYIRDLFTFSKKDRIGIITLLILIALVYFIPDLLFHKTKPFPFKNDPALAKIFDTLNKTSSFQKQFDRKTFKTSLPSNSSYQEGELFTFDPNTLSIEGWQKLGLNDHVIKTIEKYLSKNGRFYKEEDLKKIWGMPEGFYDRVKKFISIPQLNKTPFTNSKPQKKEFKSYDLDINLSDTSSFIALPGIGSKLAARIINFREKLGGFYSVDQIKETYGISDSIFKILRPYLHISEPRLKMVNINTATKEELKAHPYIKWNLANALVEYRNQHGPYLQISDLKKVSIVTEDVYRKLTPYLKLQ